MNTLMILNDPLTAPNGAITACAPPGALLKQGADAAVVVFLLGDALHRAQTGQKTPNPFIRQVAALQARSLPSPAGFKGAIPATRPPVKEAAAFA